MAFSVSYVGLGCIGDSNLKVLCNRVVDELFCCVDFDIDLNVVLDLFIGLSFNLSHETFLGDLCFSNKILFLYEVGGSIQQI